MISTALLLALSSIAQPTGSASQPAQGGTGTAQDISADVMIILEFGDEDVSAQESWNLRNRSGRRVSQGALAIEMPPGTSRLQLDESSPSFRATEDSRRIESKTSLGQETTTIGATYRLPSSAGRLELRRRLPFSMSSVRLIMEDVAGLSMSSNIKAERRERDLNGIRFAIWDFPPAKAGEELVVTLTGIPHYAVWPKAVMLVASVLVIAWMLFALVTGRVPGYGGQVTLGPLSAQARQARIIRGIEILEADHKAEKISDKRYQRRQNALLKELAEVLRQRDLEEASSAATQAGSGAESKG